MRMYSSTHQVLYLLDVPLAARRTRASGHRWHEHEQTSLWARNQVGTFGSTQSVRTAPVQVKYPRMYPALVLAQVGLAWPPGMGMRMRGRDVARRSARGPVELAALGPTFMWVPRAPPIWILNRHLVMTWRPGLGRICIQPKRRLVDNLSRRNGAIKSGIS